LHALASLVVDSVARFGVKFPHFKILYVVNGEFMDFFEGNFQKIIWKHWTGGS
jgi:hypothetical protein